MEGQIRAGRQHSRGSSMLMSRLNAATLAGSRTGGVRLTSDERRRGNDDANDMLGIGLPVTGMTRPRGYDRVS